MAKLEGHFASMRYERTDAIDWTDPKTGTTRTIKKFVGVCEYEKDGKRDWLEIGFPRDPNFRAPNLTPKAHYLFPVTMFVDKKGNVRLTLRTDVAPVEAPDLDQLI